MLVTKFDLDICLFYVIKILLFMLVTALECTLLISV